MSPLPSFAGARARIFLSVFHSDMSRQSAPLMNTPARSCSPIPRCSPRIVNLKDNILFTPIHFLIMVQIGGNMLKYLIPQIVAHYHWSHLVPGGPSLGDMPVTIGGGPILLALALDVLDFHLCNNMPPSFSSFKPCKTSSSLTFAGPHMVKISFENWQINLSYTQRPTKCLIAVHYIKSTQLERQHQLKQLSLCVSSIETQHRVEEDKLAVQCPGHHSGVMIMGGN